MWELDLKEGWAPKNWCFQTVVLEKILESLGQQGDHWKDWCWSSNILATWCKEPGDRGWDGWMASSTQWTWVWANSKRQWRTGKPGGLLSTGSQRVGHPWMTEQRTTTKNFKIKHLRPVQVEGLSGQLALQSAERSGLARDVWLLSHICLRFPGSRRWEKDPHVNGSPWQHSQGETRREWEVEQGGMRST